MNCPIRSRVMIWTSWKENQPCLTNIWLHEWSNKKWESNCPEIATWINVATFKRLLIKRLVRELVLFCMKLQHESMRNAGHSRDSNDETQEREWNPEWRKYVLTWSSRFRWLSLLLFILWLLQRYINFVLRLFLSFLSQSMIVDWSECLFQCLMSRKSLERERELKTKSGFATYDSFSARIIPLFFSTEGVKRDEVFTSFSILKLLTWGSWRSLE